MNKRATGFVEPSGLESVVLAGTDVAVGSATGPARTAAERRGTLRTLESLIVDF